MNQPTIEYREQARSFVACFNSRVARRLVVDPDLTGYEAKVHPFLN